MVSRDPPPYTQDQIAAMTSPEEKIRAMAELKSYIARMKKENELRSNGYSGSGYRNTSGTFNHHESPHYPRGSYRGAYHGGRGRGHTPYHPYSRPYTTPHFAHSSVAVKGTGNAIQSLKVKEEEDLPQATADGTVSSSSDHQQPESRRLCAIFTSTGDCYYGESCRLSHIRRATRMRKATRGSSPALSPSSNSPGTSDTPDEGMDTAQDAPEWTMPKNATPQTPQQFTQQADFVAFETDE
ncbi:unnamed protein product [Alternaria alternata]